MALHKLEEASGPFSTRERQVDLPGRSRSRLDLTESEATSQVVELDGQLSLLTRPLPYPSAMSHHVELLKTADHPERVDEIVSLVTTCYTDSPMFNYLFKEKVDQGLECGGVLSPKPCKQFFLNSFFLNFKNFTCYLKFENKISKCENF